MLTKKQKTINWILAVILLVLSIFFLFPVIWMLANSFKPDAAITADMNSIAAFIPPALNGNYFENYITILTDTNFLRYMLNTLGYAALLIVLGVIVNGLAGYALAKINFPFRDQWLLIIMMLLIVPTETVITIHFLIIGPPANWAITATIRSLSRSIFPSNRARVTCIASCSPKS